MAINVELQAEEIISDLDLTLPINIDEACKKISSNSFLIEYQETALPAHICGVSIGNTNKVQIIVNSKIHYPERRLFTGGHELGHAVLHIGTGIQSSFECSEQELKINENSQRKFEIEANKFSSALLMPRSIIQKKINQKDITWDLIQDIANACQTSLEATARRIISLTNEPYALVIYQNQKMWTPVISKKFPAFIPNSIYPKNLFSSANKPSLRKCDVSDWGIDSKRNQYICYYSSLHFEEGQRILTLLLLEEVEEEEEETTEWDEPHF